MLRAMQPVIRYGAAVAAVAVALGLKLPFSSLGVGHPFLLLPAAVIVASWYGGRGPGVLAALLAAVGTDLLYISPFEIETTPGEVVALVVMFAEGLLIVWITDGLRRARERARHEAEEADRARRSATLALQMREELLRLWSQKLAGPLAHLVVASQHAREAVSAEDPRGAAAALDTLHQDVTLLQRTADQWIEGDPARTPAP